jgi:hypothetical protein
MPDISSIPKIFSGRTMSGVPAQYTTDASIVPSRATLDALKDLPNASRAAGMLAGSLRASGVDPSESDEYRLLAEIRDRKGILESNKSRLASLFRRLDNLYYPEVVTEEGGADHWPEARKAGRAHVSVNVPPVYVDIPASLQAVVPVENYVSVTADDDERSASQRVESLYYQWKDDADFELESHKGCLVKALYGFTFSKTFWDPIEKFPRVVIIDQPENLYVGWGASDFSRMDFAIYCYGLSPQAAEEEYGVGTVPVKIGDSYYPFVTNGTHDDPLGTVNYSEDFRNARVRTQYEESQVEVYDYWYKKPGGKGKRPVVWNAIFVGNQLVEHAKHPEYDGELPYDILPNTYIPGSPYGRPELYDIEQLIREKDERLTQAAQHIHTNTDGPMWQIVGPDAPDDVPAGAIPKANTVATPGAGSEIKAINPPILQYPVEDYLKRLDLELETVSGLNELLLGRAPATVLGSSKAITALVANYEARIRMKRDLLYHWRKSAWKKAAKLWEKKDKDVKTIIDGRYRLNITAPELTPRDELEIANMAMNLVGSRIWSLERAMDRTGVEDPSDEKELIRSEQTDAALNPAAVQAQITLASAMQAYGIQPGAEGAAGAANAARQTQGRASGTPSMNGPEANGVAPPDAQPANVQASALSQTMVADGEASGRLLSQEQI